MAWGIWRLSPLVVLVGCAADNPRFLQGIEADTEGTTGSSEDGEDDDDDAGDGDAGAGDGGEDGAAPTCDQPGPRAFSVEVQPPVCDGIRSWDCLLEYSEVAGWRLDQCCPAHDLDCDSTPSMSTPIDFHPIAPSLEFNGEFVSVTAALDNGGDECRVTAIEIIADQVPVPIFAGSSTPDAEFELLDVWPVEPEELACVCENEDCCDSPPGSYALRFAPAGTSEMILGLIVDEGESSTGQVALFGDPEIRNMVSHRGTACDDTMEVDWVFALRSDPRGGQ